MKKRRTLAAGMVALASTLGLIGMVGTSVAAPGDSPAATHSQHSTHAQAGGQGGASSTTNPASNGTTPAAASALPDVASVGARPGNGKQQSLSDALAEPHGVASADNGPGNGKQQSLSDALAQPHGPAAAGVTPERAGVNDGTTKQASGLAMRSLVRGEQDAGVNDAARTGGCAPGYGDGRSCLPVAPPSAAQHAGHNIKVAWTCTELLTLFPQGIPLQVRGTDPLGLDTDGNGIACA
jgi:hypothetical protein